MAEPGWFADPVDHALLHYWDGVRWTHTVRSNSTGPPVAIAEAPLAAPAPAAAFVPPPAAAGTVAPPEPGTWTAPVGAITLVPSWLARGLALLVDAIVVYGVPAGISMLAMWTSSVDPVALLVTIVLIAVDFAILQGITGQSVGKRVASIAVVDPITRQPVGILRSAVRTAVSVLSFVSFWIVVLNDRRHLESGGRRLCDRAARTVIVPAADALARSR